MEFIMNENKPIKKRAKHPGVFSMLVFSLLKAIFIAPVAWFVLSLWFIGEYFLKGQYVALRHAQDIVITNADFIADDQSALAHSLLRHFYIIHQALIASINHLSIIHISTIQNIIQLLLVVTEINFSRLCIFLLALPLFA